VPRDAASLVELRVLDGPNLYFTRPAIKLTLHVAGWIGASADAVARSASTLGLALDPGSPDTEHRRRAVARVARSATRSIADRAGVSRLAVRARPGPRPDELVVAFPWRRRGAAEELGRATATLMAEALRRSPRRAVARLAAAVAAVDPGAEPRVPDPDIPVVQVTGTNGKTTTVRLLAHLVRTAGRHVAYSSTDGVYRDERRVKRGDYSGFGGAATALAQDADVAVLETARGGILLRGIGVLHNDVAVVTNVSADHLGLLGIETVDQLAEVKGTIVRITRPGGWDVLNADDPRVAAMRRTASGRPWVYSLHPGHPAVRETLADGGRATTVIEGGIVWLERHSIHQLANLLDVPVTLAGISSIYTSNALAATSAALALGVSSGAVGRGLRSFVPDPQRNPGRANLFTVGGRLVVIDYAHNEAGMRGLTEIVRGLRRPGAETWLAICTAGDRTDEILHGFGFQAALGADHLAIADLRHYTRGRTVQEIYDRLAAAAAEVGKPDPPRFRGELHALKEMVASSKRGDVVAVTALGMRPQIFRWLSSAGARRLTPSDVRRLARGGVAAAAPLRRRRPNTARRAAHRREAQRTQSTDHGRASRRSSGINAPHRSQRP
jgi:cyanophycin synthetase